MYFVSLSSSEMRLRGFETRMTAGLPSTGGGPLDWNVISQPVKTQLTSSRSTSTMEPSPSLLPWKWIVESLASTPEAGTSVLGAIVDRFPFVLGDTPNDVREGIALRYLEECSGMACGETPPAVATSSAPACASAAKIDASRTCEEVLRSKVATANNTGKGNGDLYGVDLHKFILRKRAALKKSSIELLKEKILRSYHPDFAHSKDFNNLPKVPRPRHVSNSHREVSDLKKFKESVKNLKKIKESMKNNTSRCMTKFTLIRKYRDLKNLANMPLKSVGGASQKHLAEQNAPDDEQRNHQPNVNNTHNGFLMDKTKLNPGKESIELHNVEIHSSKDNLLNYASDPVSAPDKLKESQSEQGSQKHNVLHHDASELQEVGDIGSDSDYLQLLEQCSMPQPCSAQNLCIKCHSNGQVLNCCGEGCSRVIHESCLSLLATVEKTCDLFYCPFCSYKNARRMFEKSKRKAEEARRNLFSFYDTGPRFHSLKRNSSIETMMASDQVSVGHNRNEHLDFPSNQQFRNNSVEQNNDGAQNRERSDGRFTEDNDQENTIAEQNQLNVAADKICKNMLPCKESFECFTYQEVQEPPIELKSKTAGRVHDSTRVSENQQPANDHAISKFDSLSSELNTSHEKNDDACVDNIMSEVNRDHMQAEERENHHSCDAAEEQIPSQPKKTSVLNVEGECDHSAKRKALSSKISNRFAKRSRREKATRTDNYPQATGSKKTEIPTSRELRKSPNRRNQCLAIKKLTIRRPKLVWKPEEEEVLEDAMQKIPLNDDGSIPWIKILEHGRRVFHESRTPIDLKDKWRNMQRRQVKS